VAFYCPLVSLGSRHWNPAAREGEAPCSLCTSLPYPTKIERAGRGLPGARWKLEEAGVIDYCTTLAACNSRTGLVLVCFWSDAQGETQSGGIGFMGELEGPVVANCSVHGMARHGKTWRHGGMVVAPAWAGSFQECSCIHRVGAREQGCSWRRLLG
jgi:hypothetical protein